MGGMAAAVSLGRAIKDARERRHLTQQQLADIVGVDRKTVDNWEHERTSPRNRMGALVQWAPELGSGAVPELPTDPHERELYDLLTSESAPEDKRLAPAQAWEVIEKYLRRGKRRIA